MIDRRITSQVLAALADTPVVVLTGARQTGKTTLVRALASSTHPARYFSFDDAGVLAAAQADPAGFVAGLDGPVVLDEVQRVPQLFLALKASVDRDRRPGRFLLTGSANVLLLPRLAELLVGRMEVLSLWPLAQSEIAGAGDSFVDRVFVDPPFSVSSEAWPQLLDRLLRGGYPEVLGRASAARRQVWFQSYITTLLQRDVRDLVNVERLTVLPRLLALLATRAASLLNTSELSRTSGIPLSTLKRYLALFEATFLTQLLPAWSGNLGKRLVKAPKLFLSDTGVLASLLGANQRLLERDRTLAGPLLENFVVMELFKHASWSQVRPRLFHFRTQTGQEVDLVLEDAAGRVVGIEVKASASVSAKDFKGLRTLAEAVGEGFLRGLVLYTGTESIPFGGAFHALPVQALWPPAASPEPSATP